MRDFIEKEITIEIILSYNNLSEKKKSHIDITSIFFSKLYHVDHDIFFI